MMGNATNGNANSATTPNLKFSQPKTVIDQKELKKKLTPIQYAVTQEKATEKYIFFVC